MALQVLAMMPSCSRRLAGRGWQGTRKSRWEHLVQALRWKSTKHLAAMLPQKAAKGDVASPNESVITVIACAECRSKLQVCMPEKYTE